MAQEACRAGEDYKIGLFYRIPCHTREFILEAIHQGKPMRSETLHILNQKATCSSYCEPTDAEVEDSKVDFETAFLNINRARKAILKQIEDSSRNCGRIPCPICGSGQLSYSRALHHQGLRGMEGVNP